MSETAKTVTVIIEWSQTESGDIPDLVQAAVVVHRFAGTHDLAARTSLPVPAMAYRWAEEASGMLLTTEIEDSPAI